MLYMISCYSTVYHHVSFSDIYSSSSDAAPAPATSFLITSTPPYGSLSRNQRPSSQSTRQSPLAVALASHDAPASPEPSFHATRCTPTSGDHAPALISFGGAD